MTGPLTPSEGRDMIRRVHSWERAASAALLADLRRRGAADPIGTTLHNWGRVGGLEPYRTLEREYRARQRRIWDTSRNLSGRIMGRISWEALR